MTRLVYRHISIHYFLDYTWRRILNSGQGISTIILNNTRGTFNIASPRLATKHFLSENKPRAQKATTKEFVRCIATVQTIPDWLLTARNNILHVIADKKIMVRWTRHYLIKLKKIILYLNSKIIFSIKYYNKIIPLVLSKYLPGILIQGPITSVASPCLCNVSIYLSSVNLFIWVYVDQNDSTPRWSMTPLPNRVSLY